ncbi:vacuole effluxer Atg22 like-domain-containing protein [Hyaloscypha finlandica]|nr:vacuole effluxer Atg22 like-domain-containing protein [Hyaloscypha finlandica]
MSREKEITSNLGEKEVGPGSYSQVLFQSALSSAGWDPAVTNRKGKCTTESCVVPWGSGTRSVARIVLIANGTCFAVMTVMFVALGSAADYGNIGLCMMDIRRPNQWLVAMVFFIIAYIAYVRSHPCIYATVFPRLVRYIPHVRKAQEENLKGSKIIQAEYGKIERNPLGNNLALYLINSYCFVLGIWWFIYQQSCPYPKLPKGSKYLRIGWKQVWLALKEIRHLLQIFIYLLVSFSILQLTYLGLPQAACTITSTFRFCYIQKYFGLKTKHMFMVTNSFSVFILFYGMLGLWAEKVGYHHVGDFWIYNILFGLFQAPYYAYVQTMMSEVTPRGYENMFFWLFGITNRTVSIINATNNNWTGFLFLFALCFAASVVIYFVDVEKGRGNARKHAEDWKLLRVAKETGLTTD